MSAGGHWNLLVFRDGKRVFDAALLLRKLCIQIDRLLALSDSRSPAFREETVEGLLRAGELECGLEDARADRQCIAAVAQVTDRFAEALVEHKRPAFDPAVREEISDLAIPAIITLSPPEGFCYYGLHPLDYAERVSNARFDGAAAAVVGIRSIGTTLSAVVAAALRARGVPAGRITVRPLGHPFDRVVDFSEQQRDWVRDHAARRASFFIADEGPGLSGSSFLAVAEALVEAGVPPSQIVLLPSSEPNLTALLARNAAARWRRFRAVAVNASAHIPGGASECIGGGKWRPHLFESPLEWPAVWPWTERQKFLSADGSHVYRFDGYGHYGKAVRGRTELLAASGWGPNVEDAGDGFSCAPWLQSAHATMKVDRATLLQIARYCAFRAESLGADPCPQHELEEMTAVNLQRALQRAHHVRLRIERPVIADGRMMPHEWLRSDGRLLKVDASSHGDDHFYPGPTDIAWDISGAIVEWRLDAEAANVLVSEYRRLSGDDVVRRLHDYLVAYCAFRLGFTVSAANSVSAEDERVRFEGEAGVYRKGLASLLQRSTTA